VPGESGRAVDDPVTAVHERPDPDEDGEQGYVHAAGVHLRSGHSGQLPAPSPNIAGGLVCGGNTVAAGAETVRLIQ
jgi:hypothetical protein